MLDTAPEKVELPKTESAKEVINDPSLSEKINRCLAEKEIVQEGFLPRDKWEKELIRSMADGTTMVVILDLVGGSRLGDAFQSRMENVLKGIQNWKQDVEGITYGRAIRVEVNERLVGQDEVLLLVHPDHDVSFPEILEKLHEEIIKTTRAEAVYTGASVNSANTPKEKALRAADIALKKTKEQIKANPEEKRVYRPGIVFVSDDQVTYENQKISREELNVRSPDFLTNVVLKDVVGELRKIEGKATVLSPRSMKDINAECGMGGGDETLVKLTKIINSALEIRGLPETKIYKIGAAFVIPNVEFTSDEMAVFTNKLPYGLVYSEVNLPSSSK